MKAGILFGSTSGKGAAERAEALLSEALKGRNFAIFDGVAVCEGPFGGTLLHASWTVLKSGITADYVRNLRSAVTSLAAWGADILVCVGGDGLASYAADAMLAGSRPMALLGVAAGTINVGPIVTLGIEELSALDMGKLAIKKVGAVEVLQDGTHLAYGFNDVVIGDTFLGTLDGKVVSLSAQAMLEKGVKERKTPSPSITSLSFSVKKNGVPIVPGMRRPAQVIIAPLGSREFYARAVAGVLCNAAYMKGGAALALFDSVMVKSGGLERGISDFSASEQLLFEPNDMIEIGGLAPEGHIIVDGNPYFRTQDVVQFRVVSDLVNVAMPEPLRKSAREED